MSKERIKTVPNLIQDSQTHQKALSARNDHFRSWQYNVIDQFKDKTTDEIKKCLKETSHKFAVLFENFIGDFNIATGIRNANAFNAREVFYIGDKKFDRRGMQGVHNYMDIKWLPTIDELFKLKEHYTFVGADNIPGSIPLTTYQWQPNSLIIFGSEGVGITTKLQSMCKDIVAIPQFGSVRSLNVGTASGIVMYDYISKIKEEKW